QEGRLCFTLGHEVGHWQLHRPLYEMDRVTGTLSQGTSGVPAFLCRSSQKPPAEVQADKFSACLLMPERFVRDAFREVHGDQPLLLGGLKDQTRNPNMLGRWNDAAKAVRTKGNFSNVSLEAMRYRLSGLRLVRDPSEQEAQAPLPLRGERSMGT